MSIGPTATEEPRTRLKVLSYLVAFVGLPLLLFPISVAAYRWGNPVAWAFVVMVMVCLFFVCTRWFPEKEFNRLAILLSIVVPAVIAPVGARAIEDAKKNAAEPTPTVVTRPSLSDSSFALIHRAVLGDLTSADVHAKYGRFDKAEAAAQSAFLRLAGHSGDARIDALALEVRLCLNAIRNRVAAGCVPST
jgi:hypothetical protein